MERIATYLVRFHGLLLLVALLILTISIPFARSLEMDPRVEKMLPPGDPMAAAYQRLQERLGGNEIVLAVYHDPELWNSDGAGLRRLEQISRELAAVEGVASVLSLAELHSVMEKLRGPLKLLSIGDDRPSPLLDKNDELAQAMADVFEGYTHRRDSQFAAVACILQADGVSNNRQGTDFDATIERLREVLARLPPPASSGILTGEPVLVTEALRMVARDGWRLGITSSVLVSLVLIICFRSLRWTLIPLAVVHWSLWTTKAILVALQLDLSLISSTLTAIVTVVGVATSIHLILRFQTLRRSGAQRRDALQRSLTALMVPITWACITDAVGFLSLMSADVGPVRDFGLMMAVGSMMVLLAIPLVVPGLALLGDFDIDPRTPKLDMVVRLALRRAMHASLQHRRLGLICLAVIGGLGVVGSARMEVETDFIKNFRNDSPLVRGYRIVERELGGAGVWDVMLPAPETLTNDYLASVMELEHELRELAVTVAGEEQLRLTKVMSIADAELASRQGPLLAALPLVARLSGMRAAMPDFTRVLLTREADADGFRWLRVMLRSREQVPVEAQRALIGKVEQTLAGFANRPQWRAHFRHPPPAPEVAGYHVILSKLVSSILADQWRCFFIAMLGITLAVTIATRSLRLALIALVPNSLPILVVLGTMGWLGLQINMGAAMIAAVSLGLSIDSSIHYLIHYQRGRQAGASVLKALNSAQDSVGLAVVLSTLALITGFLSLVSSEFIPTVVFGILASLTMLGAVVGNLIVLPLLLVAGKSNEGTD